MQFVPLPFGGVVENVVTNGFEFLGIADDVVVVFTLPSEFGGVAATSKVVARDGFECPHHFGEGLITIGRGAVFLKCTYKKLVIRSQMIDIPVGGRVINRSNALCSHNNAVNVVWHNDEGVEFSTRETVRHRIPHFLHDFASMIYVQAIIGYLAKHFNPFVCAYCDEIRSLLPIIIIL